MNQSLSKLKYYWCLSTVLTLMAHQNLFAISPNEILDKIADGNSNSALDIHKDTPEGQVNAAFHTLHGKLKPKNQQPSNLEVEPNFHASLTNKQKQGIQKINQGYQQRVQEGAIRPVKDASGKWSVTSPDGKYSNKGKHPDRNTDTMGTSYYHATGDGWWSWRISYSWWGVRVYVNHNFLYYLCHYRSWLLGASGLPGWIRTVLSIIACAPHAFDYNADGATVYITYLGAFWYSP